jgi:DNA-binding MarR family transcriptional regulator
MAIIAIIIYDACMKKPKKSPELEHHLGYWLRFVSNHVSYSFRDRIAALGVTVAEWVALRSLYNRSPCTLRQLAEQMGIGAGAASRLVERLIRKQLALRASSTEDRRFVTLELSPAGKKLIPKIAKKADLNDALFFDPLPQQDKDHLLRIMQSLVKIHGLKEKPTT